MSIQLALNLPNPLAAAQALFLDHGHPATSSRQVAERFGKKHKDVLKAIENLLAVMPDPEFSRRNFALRKYEYKTARNQLRTAPEYHLTHDGFAFLAMRFTGAEAMAWQIAFLEAFNAMEAELTARTARFATALDQVRPFLRPVVEATEAGYSRSEIAEPLGKSPASVTYHRRSARRLGLLAARGRHGPHRSLALARAAHRAPLPPRRRARLGARRLVHPAPEAFMNDQTPAKTDADPRLTRSGERGHGDASPRCQKSPGARRSDFAAPTMLDVLGQEVNTREIGTPAGGMPA